MLLAGVSPDTAHVHHAARTTSGVLGIVLYGRIGGFQRGGGSGRARDAAPASAPMIAMCAASLQRHVVAPSAAHFGRVVVIGHSWSPAAAFLLDALFNTTLSMHDTPLTEAALREHCQWPGWRSSRNLGGELADCARSYGHMLSIGRALGLKADFERTNGAPFASVLLSRWDVAWSAPLPLEAMPLPDANTFWLSRQCAPRSTGVVGSEFGRAVCGGEPLPLHGPKDATPECPQTESCCEHRFLPAARKLWLLDMWLCAMPITGLPYDCLHAPCAARASADVHASAPDAGMAPRAASSTSPPSARRRTSRTRPRP